MINEYAKSVAEDFIEAKMTQGEGVEGEGAESQGKVKECERNETKETNVVETQSSLATKIDSTK